MWFLARPHWMLDRFHGYCPRQTYFRDNSDHLAYTIYEWKWRCRKLFSKAVSSRQKWHKYRFFLYLFEWEIANIATLSAKHSNWNGKSNDTSIKPILDCSSESTFLFWKKFFRRMYLSNRALSFSWNTFLIQNSENRNIGVIGTFLNFRGIKKNEVGLTTSEPMEDYLSPKNLPWQKFLSCHLIISSNSSMHSYHSNLHRNIHILDIESSYCSSRRKWLHSNLLWFVFFLLFVRLFISKCWRIPNHKVAGTWSISLSIY